MALENPIAIMAICLVVVTACVASTEGYLESQYNFRSQELELLSTHHNLWSNQWRQQNLSLGTGTPAGCVSCGGDIFYNEPPPNDIMFIPSPPLHPSFQSSTPEMTSSNEQQCDFCHLFYSEDEQSLNAGPSNRNFNNRIVALLVAFTTISAVICLYLIGTRKSRIMASLARTSIFKSSPTANIGHHHQHHHHHSTDKTNSLHESLSNPGVHLADPCYLQTNRDKNLTSPIVSDQAPHKKTAIPSKYWAQPGSIINRTIRRVPNEYEIPSSQTNSTGTSSAVYADMNNEQNNQRFFSPYNLHTYAEVREVLDPNEHFHTSSNSSAMLSESNYDNANYSHNNGPGCVMNSIGMMNNATHGSVQMSDFNSMRAAPTSQSMAYNQTSAPTMNNNHHHQTLTHQLPKMHHNNHQHPLQRAIYEQPPPQRAQVIITSNNQGVNPTLLNYRDRTHNVI